MDLSNFLNKFKETISTQVLELCYEHITKFARELEIADLNRRLKNSTPGEAYKQGMFDGAQIIRQALLAQQKRLEISNPATNERKDDGTPQEATENS